MRTRLKAAVVPVQFADAWGRRAQRDGCCFVVCADGKAAHRVPDRMVGGWALRLREHAAQLPRPETTAVLAASSRQLVCSRGRANRMPSVCIGACGAPTSTIQQWGARSARLGLVRRGTSILVHDVQTLRSYPPRPASHASTFPYTQLGSQTQASVSSTRRTRASRA
eukprot:6130909-Prymnesium_polylepis.1